MCRCWQQLLFTKRQNESIPAYNLLDVEGTKPREFRRFYHHHRHFYRQQGINRMLTGKRDTKTEFIRYAFMIALGCSLSKIWKTNVERQPWVHRQSAIKTFFPLRPFLRYPDVKGSSVNRLINIFWYQMGSFGRTSLIEDRMIICTFMLCGKDFPTQLEIGKSNVKKFWKVNN